MVGDRHRIVNVRLANIPPDKKLEQMGQTLGFSFHTAGREDKAWAGVRLKNGDPAYEKEMENLAQAIYDTLEALREASGRKIAASQPDSEIPEKTQDSRFDLYFADVADSLLALRRRAIDWVKNKNKEVKVSDFVPAPYPAQAHNDKVIETLRSTKLSVHLLAEVPGRPIVDDPGTTYPQKQAELGIDNAQYQYVWIPEDLDLSQIDPDYGSYRNLLEKLDQLADKEKRSRSETALPAHDFIRGRRSKADELAERILQKLDIIQSPDKGPPQNRGTLLVTHPKDADAAAQLLSFLLRQGVPVTSIPQTEEAHDPMYDDEILKQISTILILFGEVAPSWAKARFEEALKKMVEGRYAISSIVVYLAPPRKRVADNDFTIGFIKATVIDHMDSPQLVPEKLKPLLSSLVARSE
jgi:hypothetical protein